MPTPYNIVDLFYQAAKKYPDKTAIVYRQNPVAFKALEEQVTNTARFFLAKGIGKGDRVLVFVPMSIDLYRIVLALFRIGATAVFLDEWVSKKRMEECCKIADSKAFIGIPKARILGWFSSEIRKIPIHLGLGYQLAPDTPFPQTNTEDTALVTFTTGSTGTPKAAKRTHGFLRAQFNALTAKINPQPDDVDMPALPIVLLINLGTGTTSVIAEPKAAKPQKFNPKKIIDQIRQNKVNRLTASPFFIKAIAKFIITEKVSDLPIRSIFTGGAPVFPSEAALYQQAFPHTNVEIVYGSTEAEPISAINMNDLALEKANLLTKGLNVGKIDKSATVKIIKITDEPIEIASQQELTTIEMPPEETGEIIVSGDHVLTEYFNNRQALKRNKIFVDGVCWHRTGDSGYLDKDGFLYLTGRCQGLIKSGDQTLSPFIFENFFSSIEGVEMGTIMELNGRLYACIELYDKSKEQEVSGFIKNRKVKIDHIIFLKKIPRDPRHNSKIEYEQLKMDLEKRFNQ